MGWQCKLCTFVATRKGAILKHYRLNHGTFGRGYSVPCLHLNCPCSFKTWGGLRTHLHRCHNSQETKDCEVLSVESLKCKLCDSLYFNTKDYFKHINSHLKSHETVQCVFKGCNFKTNICATYATHRSRNHKSWSLEDFETDLIAKQPASTDYEISSPVSHDHVDIDNTEELDCERDASSQIAKNIGSLLLKLESIYNVSGKCIDDLVEQLQFICTSSTQYVPKLVDDIFTKNNCAVDQDVVRELVDKLCHSNPLNLAFCPKGPFSTKLKREKYFKENFNVTEPVEYILDQEENHSFQYIPFLQTLQHLLNNEDILNHILTKHSNTSHLASFHDGKYFKLNECHAEDDFSISVIVYVDDFEICNPLGSSRKKHKVTAVYWVLGDVPSQLRSELTSIYLALLCKANDVKKFGYDCVLEPFLKELSTLEKEGLFLPQVGRNIRGTVVCVSADNLGAHSLSGLVESFTGHYICRFCIGDHSDYQQKEVRSGAFPARTKENYDLHVQTVQKDPALLHCYGVKKCCPITENLSYFHFVTGYPPDILHDLFEGIIPLELTLCLNLFIHKQYFTLTELNRAITHFPYRWTDKTNQPQPIPKDFALRKRICGNAHENWTLLRLLSFIIGTKIPLNDPAWQVLMNLKDITELAVSPLHSEGTISYLDTLISEHRHRLLEVFPKLKLTPKHHFLEHYPDLIRGFGPLVSLWTMRFEAKHSFFKQVARHTKNFRNVLLSLASKHQMMMAYHSQANASKPATCVTKITSLPLEILDLEIQQSFKEVYPTQTTVKLTSAVIHHGTKYAAGMVLPNGSTGGLPDFVEISQIVIEDSSLSFIVKLLNSWYDEHLRAFILDNSGKLTLLQHSELSDAYPLAGYFVGGKRMMELVALKVVLEHQSEKLTLPTGIPSTVEKLSNIVKETFGLVEEFTLHYLDEDFGDYFTLHSTNDIKNKGTIKVVIIPSVVLSFTALTENDPSSSTDTRPDIQTNQSSATDTRPDIQTDGISVSPQDRAILSPLGSVNRSLWPDKIIIPHFSMAAEEALKNANEKFVKDGTLLTTTRVRSEILEKLADYMYSYTAYPTGRQISEVAEALVKIHPCLAEPGSHTGWNGWMYSLKYKMGNYRTKLRSLGFPEVTCNSFKNKRPDDRTPAKNVKKARKGEVVFLPCYPAGIAKDQQEVDRNQLIEESKKRDSTAIKDLMCRTFAHRRHDVISLQMSIKDIKDRWPTLFNVSQVSAEFQRITTMNLEPKFMSMLDLYIPKLLTLFQVKKGGLGERLRAQLSILHQSGISIHQKREVVIRCLIDYLGEDACGLIKEFEDSADHTIMVEEELADEAIKIYILQSNGAVTDVGIVIEGITVLKNLANLSRACCFLLGLTYSLDLRYPKTHRYSFEVFQKLLLELDPAKLSVKVQRLKNQLLG